MIFTHRVTIFLVNIVQAGGGGVMEWGMFSWHTNLHQLQDAILSIWECFQHLVESTPRRIKAVLKVKGGQTHYLYGVPNNPLGECICCFSLKQSMKFCMILSTILAFISF